MMSWLVGGSALRKSAYKWHFSRGLRHVQSSVLLRLHGLIILDVHPLEKKLLYFIELLLLALVTLIACCSLYMPLFLRRVLALVRSKQLYVVTKRIYFFGPLSSFHIFSMERRRRLHKTCFLKEAKKH